MIFADLPLDSLLRLYRVSERVKRIIEPLFRGRVWPLLPNEVLGIIAEQCERKSLLSLSFASKYVHVKMVARNSMLTRVFA